LKTLCGQHGPLKQFISLPNSGQAFVRYNTREEAAKAQKSLNGCNLGSTTMLAEVLSESDAEQVEQLSRMQGPTSGAGYSPTGPSSGSMWSTGGSTYRPQNNGSSFGSSMWGTDLWSTASDQTGFLANDLLGGQ